MTVIAALRFIIACLGPALRWSDRRDRRQPSGALLIRMDLLGDVAFALSAARVFKESFPESEITMLTLPQTSELAKSCSDVDHVISLDTNLLRSPRTLAVGARQLILAIKQLRSHHYETVVSLYGKTASALALATRANNRVAFEDEAYLGSADMRVGGGRYSLHLRRPDPEYGWRLIEAIKDTSASSRWAHATSLPYEHDHCGPRFGLPADGAASALLQEVGIAENEGFVALHAGSGYGDFKRWAPDNYAELANKLGSAGVRTVAVGGPSDRSIAALITGKSCAASVAGRTSIGELMAVLVRAAAFVGGDSGPLHLAAILGAPIVGLYGPTDPNVYGPLPWKNQEITVLRRDIVCSPCYSVRSRAECPLGHAICMDLVSVDEVFRAVMAVTGRAGA